MECAPIREALSARLDGEAAELPDALVDDHLTACRSCTAWADELATLHRMVRVRIAEPVPDLSAAIVESFVPSTRGRRWAPSRRRKILGEPISASRWALFVVGLTQLVLAGPAVLLGEDPGATIHVARELGSFDVALAVGLLVAAWQPARAWGLLPLAAALACVTLGTSVLDVIDGRVSTLGEAHHLLNLAGVAFLWSVARNLRPQSDRNAGRTA